MYEEKLKFVQRFIDKYNDCLKEHNFKIVDDLVNEFESVFGDVFKENEYYLPTSDENWSENEKSILLMKTLLEKYKSDIKAKAEDKEYDLKMAEANATSINNSNDNTNSLNNTVTFSLSQVYDAVNNDKSLSDEDSKKLKDLLGQVEMAKAEKDKGKIWCKIKPVLTFILDKGADALITYGPYLIQSLK